MFEISKTKDIEFPKIKEANNFCRKKEIKINKKRGRNK